jgi:hypothetical protein
LTSNYFPINALLSDCESKETMASLLLRPLLRPQTLGLGLGLSLVTYHTIHQRPIRLDSGPILSGDSHRRNAQVPVVRNGHLNPVAVRQISSGSIIGMTVKSIRWEGKRLTHTKYRIVCWFGSQYIFEILGIDIGFIGGWRTGKRHQIARGKKSKLIKAKYASSRGINILPYDRLQRYVNGIDLRSAVQDNMAFKISFGTTFALAAFMHF